MSCMIGMVFLRNVVLWSVISTCSLASAQTMGCQSHIHGATSTWRVYVDRDHHFCFRYPRSYMPVRNPNPRCHGPKLEDKGTDGSIWVCVLTQAFSTPNLVRMSPTGFDSAPGPVHAGTNTFYYYGPGGGGVSYPDTYYFNLRGKILTIEFDGPYENDKTPIVATKKLEPRVLAAFSTL